MAEEKDLIISDKQGKTDQAVDALIATAAPFNEDLYNASMGEEDEEFIIDDVDTTSPVNTTPPGEIHSDNY